MRYNSDLNDFEVTSQIHESKRITKDNPEAENWENRSERPKSNSLTNMQLKEDITEVKIKSKRSSR